jgi:hypothetical protein
MFELFYLLDKIKLDMLFVMSLILGGAELLRTQTQGRVLDELENEAE